MKQLTLTKLLACSVFFFFNTHSFAQNGIADSARSQRKDTCHINLNSCFDEGINSFYQPKYAIVKTLDSVGQIESMHLRTSRFENSRPSVEYLRETSSCCARPALDNSLNCTLSLSSEWDYSIVIRCTSSHGVCFEFFTMNAGNPVEDAWNFTNSALNNYLIDQTDKKSDSIFTHILDSAFLYTWFKSQLWGYESLTANPRKLAFSGTYFFYNTDQNLIKSFSATGEMVNGTYWEGYDNGTTKIMGQYTNGLRSGTWRWYNEDGKLVRKKRYHKK